MPNPDGYYVIYLVLQGERFPGEDRGPFISPPIEDDDEDFGLVKDSDRATLFTSWEEANKYGEENLGVPFDIEWFPEGTFPERSCRNGNHFGSCWGGC